MQLHMLLVVVVGLIVVVGGVAVVVGVTAGGIVAAVGAIDAVGCFVVHAVPCHVGFFVAAKQHQFHHGVVAVPCAGCVVRIEVAGGAFEVAVAIHFRKTCVECESVVHQAGTDFC